MAIFRSFEAHVIPDVSLFLKCLLGNDGWCHHQFWGGLQREKVKSTFFKCIRLSNPLSPNLPQELIRILPRYFWILYQWPFVSEFPVMQIRHLGNRERLHFLLCSDIRNILYNVWGNLQSMRLQTSFFLWRKVILLYYIREKKSEDCSIKTNLALSAVGRIEISSVRYLS